jgi:hypothetical protein
MPEPIGLIERAAALLRERGATQVEAPPPPPPPADADSGAGTELIL